MARHRCARATFIMEAIVMATELSQRDEDLSHSTCGKILLLAKTGGTSARTWPDAGVSYSYGFVYMTGRLHGQLIPFVRCIDLVRSLLARPLHDGCVDI